MITLLVVLGVLAYFFTGGAVLAWLSNNLNNRDIESLDAGQMIAVYIAWPIVFVIFAPLFWFTK